MRIIELVLLLLCTVLPFLIALKSEKLKRYMLFLPVALLLIHVFIEGYRWQMIPAYLMIFLCTTFLYAERVFFTGGIFKRVVVGLCFLFFLIVAWILPIAFPVFELPEPTGAYQVGARDLYFQTEHEEIITEDPTDKRELMIKAWFPANTKNADTESYFNKADRQGFALKYGLPKASFNYLDLVKTNTYKDAEVVTGTFPVLIFSHGQYSNASGYYAIIENIVSHGYIVLVINHTYESIGTVFPDGRITYFNQAYDRKKLNQEMAELSWTSTQDFLKARTETEKRVIAENLVLNYYATEITQRWARDIEEVINQLEIWNTETFLAKHIDLDNIGVFGHSQGGAAIGQAMVNDPRIKAGFNIDGVQWGSVINDTIRQPFALLSSDWNDSHPKFNTHIYREDNMKDFTDLRLLKSGHASFMDIPYLINIPKLNEAGSIEVKRASTIVSEAITRFFDEHLRDEREFDVNDLMQKYPELQVEY